MTDEQKARVTHDWSQLAGEPIAIEKIGSAVYGYGSELGCLRIFYRMRIGRAEFSKNMDTWYYCNQ